MPTMEPKPAFQSREAAELAERRKPTYVHLSSAAGTSSSVLPWLVALLLAIATLAAGLYAARFEHFLIANGGYMLRVNRFTGKVCYIPADPEWERVLEGRQALLNRCAE